MEYLKNLEKLHLNAVEFLDFMQSEKYKIYAIEQNQKKFKKEFGVISPIFANQILIGHRKIKMLGRGYSKIMKQINL